MKAQIAMLEAIVAMSIGTLALSAVAYPAYAYPSDGVSSIALHNAVFDIVGLASRTSTFNACLAAWDTQCLTSYLHAFMGVYSLQYASVQKGPSSASSGSQAACRRSISYCVPLANASSYTVYCFDLCGR